MRQLSSIPSVFGPVLRAAAARADGWRGKMAHLITSDADYRDLTHDEAYRLYLITRTGSPNDYRFGRASGKRFRVQTRRALRRVNGFLKNMIEAIANSKVRRMQRELELRGIRFDRDTNDWVARHSGPTGRSR